ncbi:MAG TPA: DDE-type integrase/transposase/recombinase [Candidatus Acidoferrum sp.]|nr:DDE-type integrase/transposase/recombinase [Candidatus Acidoferrum sp.]
MAFREVTMLEVKEVVRRWIAGEEKRAIARQVGVSRNTVRRYVKAAIKCGLRQGAAVELTDERLAPLLVELKTPAERTRGESWAVCEARRSFIATKLTEEVKLSKVARLLKRQGVTVPYATLHRFAVSELGFGAQAPTIPVADCAPGAEVQLDTGWMTLLEKDLFGKRRRFRAWIFTSVYSRHRFVWPCFEETTKSAIEACEAAWAFFGGVFAVVIPDNTKTIVNRADPLRPLINEAFLEYAQARGFTVDPTRSGHPKDKARVERTVPTVREDCFKGERLLELEDCRRRAQHWCLEEYGMRRHTRTLRLPKEAFEADEKSRLLPAPAEPYDVPLYSEPKVAPDQHVSVAKALYSLAPEYRRQRLKARADRSTVRLYWKGQLIETHVRQPPGGRSTKPEHFPPEQLAYAQRDTAFLVRQAEAQGPNVGAFALALLDNPQPWTRMRQCFALLSLCKRFSKERVEETCALAIASEMHDYWRLERMVKQAIRHVATPQRANNVVPLARYLRPAHQYALPLASRERAAAKTQDKETKRDND